MMDALEGILEPNESAELNLWLADHPDEAQEWEAMQAVDGLLRASQPMAAPVHFAERTLGRIPNPRNRRLFMFAFYLVMLMGGLLPILFGILLSTQLGSAAFGGFSIFEGFDLLRVISSGLVSAIRTVVVTQPVVFGWLSAMLAAIFVWAAVFRQYSGQVRPVLVTA